MRRSVKGGSRLHKVGTHLAPAAIPVLAGLRCVLLRQPGSSGSCALFCAAAERCSSGCVVVVEEGIRGRAGRAQTAARCATSGCGPRQWPHRAAAWLPPRPSCRVRPAPLCSQSEERISFSKIRARHLMRNRLVLTLGWTDERRRRTCERQVFHRKVLRSTRPPPVDAVNRRCQTIFSAH